MSLLRSTCVIALLFTLPLLVYAETSGISTSLTFNKEHELWVRVTNHFSDEITVQKIMIEFQNAKATEQSMIRCQENCRVNQNASKEFGPLPLPKKAKDTKVTDVKFSRENVTQTEESMATKIDLTDFATRYAKAWSSQNADALASFYSESGSLSVNDGPPAKGRKVIAEKVRGFMTGFPDMVVVLDRLVPTAKGAEFHWIWTGTNTGPGGTGKKVRIKGYEEWTLGEDGLILESKGHYDNAEYEYQLVHGVD